MDRLQRFIKSHHSNNCSVFISTSYVDELLVHTYFCAEPESNLILESLRLYTVFLDSNVVLGLT